MPNWEEVKLNFFEIFTPNITYYLRNKIIPIPLYYDPLILKEFSPTPFIPNPCNIRHVSALILPCTIQKIIFLFSLYLVLKYLWCKLYLGDTIWWEHILHNHYNYIICGATWHFLVAISNCDQQWHSQSKMYNVNK